MLRAISSSNAPVARSALAGNAFRARLMSSVRYPARPTASPSLALAAHKPVTTALVRYASTTGSHEGEDEPDMSSAIKKDFVRFAPSLVVVDTLSLPHLPYFLIPCLFIMYRHHWRMDIRNYEFLNYWLLMWNLHYLQGVIKETFSLAEVPRDALTLGLAGVVPYLATSLQTVYLAYETNLAAAGGSGLILSGQTAELALHLLEPIQVGYGAVVSSCRRRRRRRRRRQTV